MNTPFDLTDKVAIVTGASRGLGKAISIGLAKAGSNVVAVDVLDVGRTIKEVRRLGRDSIGVKVDVRKKREVEAMVKQTLDRFGKVDILVNNAGIIIIAPTVEMSEEDWDKVLDINLKGQFLCAQAVGKVMIKQRSGKIINISSINGEFVFPNSAAYNASKAGVILLTKTLAYEWGKNNINVNAICPGFMETPMLWDIHKDQRQLVKKRLRDLPLGRFARPEDFIGTVIYLASKASNYVTGHALFVDGGWTLGWPGIKRLPLDPALAQALQNLP